MEKVEETKCTALVHLRKEERKEQWLVPQPSLKEILGKFSMEEILSSFTAEEILGYFQMHIPPAAPVGLDNVWKSKFFLASKEVFGKLNFSPDHIRLGLNFLVDLVSAHVGYPIMVEVIDEVAAGAADVLQRCKELVGISFWKTFQQMSRNDLVAAKADIKGKCIAEMDSTKFEKGKNILNQFLADQKYVDQETITSKFGPITVPTEIEGPTACLLISNNPKKLILTHPTFLGIHFKTTTQGFYAPELEGRGKAQLKMKSDAVKSYLQRLQEAPVKIPAPYRDAIVQHLQASKNPYVVKKIDMLLRKLKAVTIINYSSGMTTGEIYNRWNGTDPKTVELALDLPSISQGFLVVRKFDYIIFWILVDGMIRIEEISFSERERRIFTVVKNFHESALNSSSLMPPNATKFQKLAQIARSPFTWPDKLKVFELVNQDGGEEIGSTSTVYDVLQTLEEKGVMKNEKDPTGRKHGFYVTTGELSDTISLPHPSEIDDPRKDPIKFINPITGESEEM